MTTYRTILVGIDGSDTSLRALDEAARVAAKSGATLILATVHPPDESHGKGGPDPDQHHGEAYRTEGNAPLYAMLSDAESRARAAGATAVETRAVEGAPADAIVELADELGADLIVVGNVGMNSMVGRLVGSVPRLVKRRAKAEVLMVETDG